MCGFLFLTTAIIKKCCQMCYCLRHGIDIAQQTWTLRTHTILVDQRIAQLKLFHEHWLLSVCEIQCQIRVICLCFWFLASFCISQVNHMTPNTKISRKIAISKLVSFHSHSKVSLVTVARIVTVLLWCWRMEEQDDWLFCRRRWRSRLPFRRKHKSAMIAFVLYLPNQVKCNYCIND